MAVTKEYKCTNEECNMFNQVQEFRVSMSQSVVTCPHCYMETLERCFAIAPLVHYNGQWFVNNGSY